MKIKQTDLTKEQSIETLDSLYTAAASVKGRAAMKLFLRDLMTPSERVMLGRRLLIARRLLQGKSYIDIRSEMKVGKQTITNVRRWLSDQMPGYENAIKEMEKEFERRKKKYEKPEPFSYRWLKKKYPLHFLLFP